MTKTKQSLLSATCFPLVFYQTESDRKKTSEEVKGREQDRRQKGGKVTVGQTTEMETRQREGERLVFPTPRWFVMLGVRHISLGLPGSLQECELLQQESASSASPPL